MNKLEDLIKILEFCRENKDFIKKVYENTTLCSESLDNLRVYIIFKNGVTFNIYDSYYETDGVKSQYNNIDELLEIMRDMLWKYNIVITETKLNICQLETIFNCYLQKTIKNKEIVMDMINLDLDKKIKSLKKFSEDIENGEISIMVFKTFRDLLYYLYVDGYDEEQILDGIEGLAKKGLNFDNILQIDNGIYVLYQI